MQEKLSSAAENRQIQHDVNRINLSNPSLIRCLCSFTEEEESSSAHVLSQSPEEERAQRVRGSEAHHHVAYEVDPQSARYVVLQNNKDTEDL